MEFQRAWELDDYGDGSSNETQDIPEAGDPALAAVDDETTDEATDGGSAAPALPRVLATVQQAFRRPNLVVASAGLGVCFVAVLAVVAVNSWGPPKSTPAAQNHAQTSGGADSSQRTQPGTAQNSASGNSHSPGASASGSGTPQARSSGTPGSGTTKPGNATKQGTTGQGNPAKTTDIKPTSSGYIIGLEGKCIGASRRGTADGTVVDLYPCVNDATQKWWRSGDGTIRTAGKCMEIARSDFSNGVPVQISACNGSQAQQWVYTAGHDLVNPYANKCLDLRGPSSADYTVVQIWDCIGASNQKWTIS